MKVFARAVEIDRMSDVDVVPDKARVTLSRALVAMAVCFWLSIAAGGAIGSLSLILSALSAALFGAHGAGASFGALFVATVLAAFFGSMFAFFPAFVLSPILTLMIVVLVGADQTKSSRAFAAILGGILGLTGGSIMLLFHDKELAAFAIPLSGIAGAAIGLAVASLIESSAPNSRPEVETLAA